MSTALTTLTSTTATAAPARNHAPASVIAGRIVLALHGLALVGLGVLMLQNDRVATVLGVVTAAEGLLRIVLAAALRQDARRTRTAVLVLAALGVAAGAMNLPLGIIGIAVNVAIIRCLSTEAAKEHLDAWT